MTAASFCSFSRLSWRDFCWAATSRWRGRNSFSSACWADLAWGDSSRSLPKLTTPILMACASAPAAAARERVAASANVAMFRVMCLILPRCSECGSDRELEALDLVRVANQVTLIVVQRYAVAEPEHAERREPLDGQARGLLQLIVIEVVVHRRAAVAAHELDPGALREDVADVEEGADPRARAPFLRHREQELGPPDHLQVAAVGVAESVLRPEAALGEAAHGVRSAREELPVRRQRGGVVAERVAVGDVRADGNRPLLPDREELQVIVA